MSHRTLERVFVRMLFDPRFVEQVYAGADLALEGLDLEAHERAQLVAVDRRAWGHDPMRRYRTLRTLAEEFKASTTLALATTRSLGSLDAFFSSPEFHTSVQERGSMAIAFSAFLERLVAECPIETPLMPDVVRLETLLARCRREIEVADPPSDLPVEVDGRTLLRLAPGHAVGRFDANVLDAVNAAERYLFEVGLMPAVALCHDAPALDEIPPLAGEPAYLLVLPSLSGISLMPLDADYYNLLDQFSAGPCPLADAAKRAVGAGVADEDIDGMVESLIEEEVLTA